MSGLFQDENPGGLCVEAKVVDFAPGGSRYPVLPFIRAAADKPLIAG